MLTTIHHLQKYEGPNTGHFDNPRPDLDPGYPPEDEVETHLGAIEAPRPMGFGTLPQVRLTVPPPESKMAPSRPRPNPPDAQEEPDTEGSDDESDDENETIKKPPDLPMTSPSSEQEEDSSQEEGEFHTPDRTLSSIPGRPDPETSSVTSTWMKLLHLEALQPRYDLPRLPVPRIPLHNRYPLPAHLRWPTLSCSQTPWKSQISTPQTDGLA